MMASRDQDQQAGFTLIEMLVAITILAILLAVALLTIPNHDDRYWRDNLDQLVSSLNMAQEESAMSGNTITVQIDSLGWRFYAPTPNSSATAMIGIGGVVSNGSGNSSTVTNNGLMPDVYRPQSWYKPVEINPVQFTLGGEAITQTLQIPIAQEQRRAVLLRSTGARFSWVSGVVQ